MHIFLEETKKQIIKLITLGTLCLVCVVTEFHFAPVIDSHTLGKFSNAKEIYIKRQCLTEF